jgi:hypothetical protein
MPASIPASAIVNVNPGVVTAGGSALSLNGVVLTASTRVPIGSVLSFPSQTAVAAYFGATSQEAGIATVYFTGFENKNATPGAILFSQYPTSNVSAYLRGGAVSGLTLTQLQALSGVLAVTIDGTLKTSSAINLSGATSFTNAAQLINRALGATGPQTASVTGAIAATTLTVSAVSSGALHVGDVLSGTGITAGTYITAFVSGTGGTGTYTVSDSQTAGSTTVTATAPVVTFDSVSGAFVVTSATTGTASTITYGSNTIADGLKLTQAQGAVLSQGANAATPAAAMNAIITQTQNWATFMTTFEPVTADKIAFAAWTSGQNKRFAYVMWDTDVTVTQPNPTSSAGYQIIQLAYDGTILIYEPSDLNHAAFVCGCVASLDFTETNGRATMAFRTQGGLAPGVTDQTIAAQLLLNGYNFYGAYATASQGFDFFYNGSITGVFDWADSYVNQIQFNAALQQALVSLLTSVKSVPYSQLGYGLLQQACMDPINAALNFGTIRAGVALSASQAAQVNAAAGQKIDTILSTRGWYLQIKAASAQTRAARQSPPMTLWYTDGQSVQQINLASIEVQ